MIRLLDNHLNFVMMKAVRLLIMLCSVSVFMGTFVLSCSAEDLAKEETVMDIKDLDNAIKGSGNSATVEWEVEWDYWLDVECDGFTDFLSGPVTAHVVSHYKNGEMISTIYRTRGVVESANTDEVFIVNEVSRDNFGESYIDFQFNIRGDMGTHYIGRMIWDYEPGDWDTGILITRRFVCPGN